MLDIEQVNIQFESFDKIIIGYALIDTLKVAKVNLIKQGDAVKLADIYVYKPILASSLVGKFKQFFQTRSLNFREKGIGTKLLEATITHSQELGFKEIFGVMKGDNERLRTWYISVGFAVDMETNIIILKL